MTPVLVVIDDEPIVGCGLRAELEAEPDLEIEVRTVDRPRRLREFDDLTALTHAVVDLSFGRDDMDGPCLRPELENGTDAIDFLRAACPQCGIVVATRNDTAVVTEIAVAIRQTWPDIRFLHKADGGLADRVGAFVRGDHYQDNAEIALDLIGVGPVPGERLQLVVEATGRARPTARLLLALADQPDTPTRQETAEVLGVSEPYVRSLVHEVTRELLDRRLLGGERGGIGSLWRWANARRAILRRTLAPVLG
ncbi:MAG: hypothetical protein AAFN30_03695 [Actinomycetota bacterium]